MPLDNKPIVKCTCIDEDTLTDITGALRLLRTNTLQEIEKIQKEVVTHRQDLKLTIMRSRISRLDASINEVNKIKIC